MCGGEEVWHSVGGVYKCEMVIKWCVLWCNHE